MAFMQNTHESNESCCQDADFAIAYLVAPFQISYIWLKGIYVLHNISTVNRSNKFHKRLNRIMTSQARFMR